MVTHDERMLEYCDKVYEIIDGVLRSETNHECWLRKCRSRSCAL